jgi:hypothetical protein
MGTTFLTLARFTKSSSRSAPAPSAQALQPRPLRQSSPRIPCQIHRRRFDHQPSRCDPASVGYISCGSLSTAMSSPRKALARTACELRTTRLFAASIRARIVFAESSIFEVRLTISRALERRRRNNQASNLICVDVVDPTCGTRRHLDLTAQLGRQGQLPERQGQALPRRYAIASSSLRRPCQQLLPLHGGSGRPAGRSI